VFSILGQTATPMAAQQGFSITGYLASVLAAGVITTAMLPGAHDTVDTADRNALVYARGALLSAMQVNHLISQTRGGSQLEIDGATVPLPFGYPLASAASLRSVATLEGYEIDDLDSKARIWSPGREYCMFYEPASAGSGAKSHPVLTDILSDVDGQCA